MLPPPDACLTITHNNSGFRPVHKAASYCLLLSCTSFHACTFLGTNHSSLALGQWLLLRLQSGICIFCLLAQKTRGSCQTMNRCKVNTQELVTLMRGMIDRMHNKCLQCMRVSTRARVQACTSDTRMYGVYLCVCLCMWCVCHSNPGIAHMHTSLTTLDSNTHHPNTDGHTLSSTNTEKTAGSCAAGLNPSPVPSLAVAHPPQGRHAKQEHTLESGEAALQIGRTRCAPHQSCRGRICFETSPFELHGLETLIFLSQKHVKNSFKAG